MARAWSFVWLTWTAGWMICATAVGQFAGADPAAGKKMAETVLKTWAPGATSGAGADGAKWRYEEGILLDGMVAEWEVTRDQRYFDYVKAAVDVFLDADGGTVTPIKGYPVSAHSLDNVEMGRAALFLYRETKDARYKKVADFLHAQLEVQPRNASGGYWHKQVYPNQIWLDGAYMAEPFRAAYAAEFKTGEWGDIAHQFLLMDAKMRDARTGLLRHGWDESRAMGWADKKTGLSPEAWGRAMGWYAMALVDVLDWVPEGQERDALVGVLQRTAAAIDKYQDVQSGLWWDVLGHPTNQYGMVDSGWRGRDPKAWAGLREREKAGADANYLEASASCMFIYALEKGVRKGWLAKRYEGVARRGWDGVNREFIKAAGDGVSLTGVVAVSGLGGSPYRSGTYEYYVREKVVADDPKGVGAYLMAGSEMERQTKSR